MGSMPPPPGPRTPRAASMLPPKFTSSQQQPRLLSSSTGSPFSIGDKVRLPEGQYGILRYVGPITGKPGDFAGVELVDEWAMQGRHNGEFNG